MGLDMWLANDPKSYSKTCEICEMREGYQYYADQWCCDNCEIILKEMEAEEAAELEQESSDE